MLGVATLIVVNSVMSGFSNKLKEHLNGLMSDVALHTEASAGFALPPTEIERRLRTSSIGRHIEAVSPTVDFYAMLQYQVRSGGQLIPVTKMVRIVGIDPERHARVGRFSEYLLRSKDHPASCFTMSAEAQRRYEHNRDWEAWEARREDFHRLQTAQPLFPPAIPDSSRNAFGATVPTITPRPEEGRAPTVVPNVPEPVATRPRGIVLGYSIAHQSWTNPTTHVREDVPLLLPGDEVFVATIGSSGTRPVSAHFVVTDYFKSEMSEYDGNVVYVPLEDLQRLRAMENQVNNLQIRLTADVRHDSKRVHEEIVPVIQSEFPKPEALAQSWWQQQGPLFAAIDIERGLLNILLFLIVGVAGFGVLAIFSMIVAEKYRDIGILKSLGASSGGVMGIFIGYGLLLGLIGCVLGTVLGLSITDHLNEIEQVMAKYTGREIFDRKVYYFDKIPTNVDALSVVLVNLGAIAIAVISSIWPAARAARLQPVRALRFE
jgi:lipoprotein-releasing system permease protein